MDLLHLQTDSLVVAIAIALAVFLISVVLPILWAVTSRRAHAEWGRRWIAICVGAFLIAIPAYIWTRPSSDFETHGTSTSVEALGVLAGVFCGPWILAWGSRRKKVEEDVMNSKPRKGIIYTSSEIEDFKRRGRL
jgi:hypothetical protein